MKDWLHILALISGLWAFAPAAQAQDAMMASEVSVDVVGTDAADARLKAMSKAEREGLIQLMKKLDPSHAEDSVAPLSEEQISAMTRGTEVLEEKISGNRYRARLNISYSGEAVDKLLGKAIEPPKSALAGGTGGVLVLPAFDDGDQLLLWEEKNPWRRAWSRAALEQGKGNVVVPYGDSNDTAVINVSNVMGINYDAAIPLLERYGTGDLAVLQARLVGGPTPSLTVMRRHIGPASNEVGSITYTAASDEDANALMQRAARDLAVQLAQRRSADKAIADYNAAPGGRQMMVASISTLAAWTQIRSKLSTIPSVQRIEVLAMAPRQVDINVLYKGDEQVLRQAVEATGLRVVPSGNYWVIGRD